VPSIAKEHILKNASRAVRSLKTSYNVISANLVTKVKEKAKAFAQAFSFQPVTVAV